METARRTHEGGHSWDIVEFLEQALLSRLTFNQCILRIQKPTKDRNILTMFVAVMT